MAIAISPFGNSPLYLQNLEPASGYKLYIYQAWTSNKVIVYGDSLGTPQKNPVTLDASGWPEHAIYLSDSQNYRFVYAHPLDQDPPLTQITPPIDNVALLVPPAQVVASEWVAGSVPTFISTTQFSVTGNQESIYHIGRRIKADQAGETLYGTINGVSFNTVTTVNVKLDGGLLASSLSMVSLSFMNALNSAWPAGRTNGLTNEFHGPITVPLDKGFSIIPAGTVIAYAGQTYPPPGWLLTDGASHLRETYPNLSSALPGSGGISFFNTPVIANLQTNIRYIIRYA